MKKAKLGTGERFKKLEGELEDKGAKDPGALAAWIGRRKYGKGRFQKLAAKGRRSTKGSAPFTAEELRQGFRRVS